MLRRLERADRHAGADYFHRHPILGRSGYGIGPLVSDGIVVPDVADQSPGKERLTNVYERAELFTGSGEVRVKRLVGIGVFNTADERLGTIRDVLLTPGGEPQVILEAAGREVAVPWSKLKFALPGDELHGQVVLPGMTQHALEQLPELGPQNRHDSG